MKKILGLDLGTTSIGWAFVLEAENEQEHSSIIDMGVRVNPLTTDEQQDFEKGRPLGVNADRTLKRGARRNLQRYKQRRNNLISLLKRNYIIGDETVLAESGKETTHQTIMLRAKAAETRIEKEELARVLLAINKKRGYKSNRKVKDEDTEGALIDGMSVARKLYEDNLTPGMYSYELLKNGKKILPDYYRSDLITEFDRVWKTQKRFHPDMLDEELYKALEGQGMQNSRKRILAIKGVYTLDIKEKKEEKRLFIYQLRSEAVIRELNKEEVALVLVEINNDLSKSSGYLGAISDRSKELFFNDITVGQYLYSKIRKNPYFSLKNQVFYRQDYLDEFERIWETQKKFHPELTESLKSEIRDVTIFYQRRLKSQKGLLAFCEFEAHPIKVMVDGKQKIKMSGPRVCPRSSPVFQAFKIWQNISNLEFRKRKNADVEFEFDDELKTILYKELSVKGNLKKDEIFRIFGLKPSEWDLNFSEVQGDVTRRTLYNAFAKILEAEGYEIDFKKETADGIREKTAAIIGSIGINTSILDFDPFLTGSALTQQSYYRIWHLLYSYEGDSSKTGNDGLYRKLETEFGFKKEHAAFLVNIKFLDDYGSLSTKAMRKILPFLTKHCYSDACELAGYNHSHSITGEENEKRILKDHLDLLEKNSLRNPVVEKILNQMVNLINSIIDDPRMGKPDEVRLELARELKKNAKERQDLTSQINQDKLRNEGIRQILKNDFGIINPSRNDIIRYKLYEELKDNGYHTLYSNQYIPPNKLFSRDVDIEHIIPQSRLFDDSFSNKTLEYRAVNMAKGEMTAYDYIESVLGKAYLENYIQRVEKYYKDGFINKSKYQKLLKRGKDIGEGFIERDLRESQYIARKARTMLSEITRNVVSTSGSITARLREDWGIINVMKELNIQKFRALGLTHIEQRKDGQQIEMIDEWTKRNDHRHHAMDALTVAFTKHSHIQYLNNLNARKDENSDKHKIILAIEQKETVLNGQGKRIFKEPIPNFRKEAKFHLERILVSHKAKNKVVTQSRNKIKGSKVVQVTLTPRGQLHNETVYGGKYHYVTKIVKVGTTFNEEVINQVSKKAYREALIRRLQENEGDPKKAFGGKNSPSRNPVLLADGTTLPEKVKLSWLEMQYTIRKEINPELKLDKVLDYSIQRLLKQRLDDFSGNAKAAFSNLEENPIWIDKDKGISLKRVTITGVSNADALHAKKDHHGKIVLNKVGKEEPSDYINTGNNHHVAIYRDENGTFQEEVVSLYEAVARVNQGLPVINKEHKNGWEFLFTIKQNEMFVFPENDFDPQEIDLLDRSNKEKITKHLYRVQKFGSLNSGLWFRHHLETNVEVNNRLKGITFKVIQSLKYLESIQKVRINNIGNIVQIGEY